MLHQSAKTVGRFRARAERNLNFGSRLDGPRLFRPLVSDAIVIADAAHALRRRARNNQIRKTVRGAVRDVREAKAGGNAELPKLLSDAERLLRKAASKGVMHKRTVSRTVSRLAKLSAR